MKKVASFLSLFVFLCGIALSQTETSKLPKNDIQFSIQTEGNWSGSERQRLLSLTIKNNCQGRIIIKEVGDESERNYQVELRNSKGEIVPLSDAGKSLTSRRQPEVSVIYVRLKPGEEITRTLDLSKLYSLQDDEKYTITVTKSVYIEADEKYLKLQSNVIESP